MAFEEQNQGMKVGSWRLDQANRLQEMAIRAASARLDRASKYQDILGKQINNMRAGVELDRAQTQYRSWKLQISAAKRELRRATKQANWLSKQVRAAERIKLGHGLRDDLLSSSSAKVKKCLRSLKNVINTIDMDVYSMRVSESSVNPIHWVAGRRGKFSSYVGPETDGTISALDLIDWARDCGMCPKIGTPPYNEFAEVFELIETKAAMKHSELAVRQEEAMAEFAKLTA